MKFPPAFTRGGMFTRGLSRSHRTVREMDSQLAWLAFCADGRNKCVAALMRKTAHAIYTHGWNDASYTIIVWKIDNKKVPIFWCHQSPKERSGREWGPIKLVKKRLEMGHIGQMITVWRCKGLVKIHARTQQLTLVKMKDKAKTRKGVRAVNSQPKAATNRVRELLRGGCGSKERDMSSRPQREAQTSGLSDRTL